MTKKQFEKLLDKEPIEIDFDKLDKKTLIKLYKHFHASTHYWFEMYEDIANEYEKKFDKIEQIIKGDLEENM